MLSNIVEKFLHRLDVAVRRKSRFGQFPWLRRILLNPYRRLINFHGRGVLMNIGGCIPARMPPEYAWKMVEDYEPETLSVIKKWLEIAEKPLVVDVGCSLGFISCASLFCNSSARVIAIDSDLQSLKAAQCLCSYAPHVAERLFLVWGFVSNQPTQTADFLHAHQATLPVLNQPGISGSPDAIQYICLDSTDAARQPIPRHSLDNLIPSSTSSKTPILIKCDVEGAELLVLESAQRLIAEHHPALLISVHPTELSKYGATKDDLHSFLSSRGYVIEIVAIDHEEHWWCMKT